MNRRDFERQVVSHLERLLSEVVAECPDRGRLRLLAGVSGGADSVAMLCALTSPVCAAYCDVTVVNCNFHLRGEESDRDSNAVRELCGRLGVALIELHFDVPAYVGAHPGTSVEMACRDLRYTEFRRLCREKGFDRVAVAHNADDNAETLLLNLMRGAGTRGLKGMLTDADGVFRPLLRFSRRQIEDYLAGIGEGYITDSSNLSTDYRRNFLRLEVLPLLESRWPAAGEMLARSAAIVAEENALVSEALEHRCPVGTRILRYDEVEECGAPVTLLLHFISPGSGTRTQAEEMARSVWRPGGVWHFADGAYVVAGEEAFRMESPVGEIAPLVVEKMEMTPSLWSEMLGERGAGTLYLPLPLEEYEVRSVREGDRMRPLGMKGSKLLSAIMKDARVPREMRSRLRVVVDPRTDEIVWLEGVRRARIALVDPAATCVWRVSGGWHTH